MSGHRIFLDSNIFIYFLERNEAFYSPASKYFKDAENGKVRILTSTLTYLEVITPLINSPDKYLKAQYDYLLKGSGLVEVCTIGLIEAEVSARLKHKYNLKTPDAIQIGCAITSDSKEFVTADSKLVKLKLDQLKITQI